MEQSLTDLLASLGKPTKHCYVRARVSDPEFFALQSFCQKSYQSYSDVIREALTQYLQKNK